MMLSEIPKLSSKDLRSWLERETGSLFVPIHSRAQRLVDDMRKMLDGLLDVSKMLLENSAREADKKNMKTFNRARALNKLARLFVDRIRQTKLPDKVTYDSFNQFVQETQRAFLVTEVDIRNWFPRISPFFILDRRKFQTVFDKAKELLQELGTFLAKEYVKAKTLEQTFGLVDKLLALEHQALDLKERRTRIESEKALVESEMAAVQQKMDDLKNSGILSELGKATAELDALGAEVKLSLHHLEKPFVKLQSLALHGEGSGLRPEQVSKLNQYVENPFEAFTTEDAGLPLLKEIAQKTTRLISESKLQLKPEKTRKAQQLISEILNNSLENLHQKSKSASLRRRQLSESSEVAQTERELAKLKGQLEAVEMRRKAIEGEQVTVERAISETTDRIRNHKSEIEKNVLSFTNKRIRID